MDTQELVNLATGDCKLSADPVCSNDENAQPSEELFRNTRKIFQPSNNKEKKCTLLLLHNLAQPEWISINCNKPMLTHVVCEAYRLRIEGEDLLEQTVAKVCNRLQIINTDRCLPFYWTPTNLLNSKTLSSQCQLYLHDQRASFVNLVQSKALDIIFLQQTLTPSQSLHQIIHQDQSITLSLSTEFG